VQEVSLVLSCCARCSQQVNDPAADAESDAVAAAEALGRGDWGTAPRLARRAAEAGINSPDMLAVRGIALARLGCIDDADSCLRSALDQVCCANKSSDGG
jgi:Flp pilus assembly protein TadD